MEGFEFEANDVECTPEFTRGSTIVHIKGTGHEGIGEDVAYEVLDHIANRDLGPRFDLTGPDTLGELCALLGELGLYDGAPPERDVSRHYRRWAYESAALDLALRQNGLALWEARARPEARFGSFARPGCRASRTMPGSSTEPITKRLDRYPGLEFKLDPENDWDAEPDRRARVHRERPVLDLKGFYKGTVVEVETDPELYRAVAETFPEAWLEDPDLNDGTREVLAPHMARVTYDATPLGRRHHRAGARARDQLQALALGVARGAVRGLRALRARGPGDLLRRPGRGRRRAGPGEYLALALPPGHAERHRAVRLQRSKRAGGMPTSPMDPVPSETATDGGRGGRPLAELGARLRQGLLPTRGPCCGP